MEKHTRKGIKRLFSLAKTKIRLAEESGTMETRPSPLLLVKKISGEDIKTIQEAKEHRERLLDSVDFCKPRDTAKTVFQLVDIIEGVKYKYEPPELCALLTPQELKKTEEKAKKQKDPINLLMMTEETLPETGINIYVGENPPENTIHLGRVPSTIAVFLEYAYKSNYLSEGLELKNIKAVPGRKTLLVNAICYALKTYGAE